jgi:RNA polymerase sigma-70 factor (ECF subfamily)
MGLQRGQGVCFVTEDDEDEDLAALLVERYRAGDQRAAEALFHRFERQLVGLAKKRMSNRLAQRLDPEDVVQSAFRSFFRGAREGRFEVEHDGGLWRLLSMITLNKVRKKAEFHLADKRALGREQMAAANESSGPAMVEAITREPSPLDAMLLVEEVEGLCAGLDETQRQMFDLRLQGYQIEEIATMVGRSERTVRRLMDKVRERLESRLQQSSMVM